LFCSAASASRFRRISLKAILKAIARGELRAIRVGRGYRMSFDVFDRWQRSYEYWRGVRR